MKPVDFKDGSLILIDQRKLPGKLVYRQFKQYRDVIEAIKNMTVRGAPAIGVTAAYAVYLASLENESRVDYVEAMEASCAQIRASRPTAVNLMWAVDRMLSLLHQKKNLPPKSISGALLHEARRINEEDIRMCRSIGANGAELLPERATVLTHCNAGALATADYGTALGVIRAAVESGKDIRVFADETRPLLQGARLTAWELHEDGIPVTLITDNMAGWMMKQGEIDAVVVGADRIAANGDSANKIGTYALSILAKYHGIPFYIAAPTSTIDIHTACGDDIIIEERDREEVFSLGGVRTAPFGIDARNPAFDVAPAEHITAIITEKGVLRPPYTEKISALFS